MPFLDIGSDNLLNAKEVGLNMENETVIIFGSPVTGTLLMKENPEIDSVFKSVSTLAFNQHIALLIYDIIYLP